MSLSTYRVPYGKGKSYGAPQAREHHSVLHAPGYLHFPSEVQDKGEGIHVQEPPQEYGKESADNVKRVKVVLGEGEHGHADVGEDEVLGHEVEKIEKALGGLLALLRQIVEGVMCLSYATEKNLYGESALS